MKFNALHIALIGLAIVLRNVAKVLRDNISPELVFLAFLFDLITGILLVYVIYDMFLKKETEKPKTELKTETTRTEVRAEKPRDISKELKRPKRVNLFKPKKIKMDTCSKNDLLSIDGFDDEKAEKFLQERKQGKIYYDLDTFVSDYGLMPHQMIDEQDRLVFPNKPSNKIGRKIDY